MDRDELQTRATDFDVRVLKLVDHLPATQSGRTVAHQLAKSATSMEPITAPPEGREAARNFIQS
jgi:hypothetical protein